MVGIVGYTKDGPGVPDSVLDSMAAEVKHFPHHKVESQYGERLNIARVHLAILNPGQQPAKSASGATLVFGEGMAYGGSGAGTNTWLERLAEDFEVRREKALKDLNGSFSLVIVESGKGLVHLVSDRYGSRPMYYWSNGVVTVFGSEPKAILRHPGYRKRLNMVAMSKFLRYGRLCLFGNDTWFEGVLAIPPGTVLTVEKGSASSSQYWDLEYAPDEGENLDGITERLVRSFREAVRIRTSNEGLRYSVALSGGLDSRAVLAGGAGQSKLTTYTMGVERSRELGIARRVANRAGVEHMVVPSDPESTAARAPDVVSLSDGMEVVGISFLLHSDEKLRGRIDVSLDGFALDLTLGGSFLRKSTMDARGVSELASLLDAKFTVFGDKELKKLVTPAFLSMMGDCATGEFRALVKASKGPTTADKADYFAMKTRVRNFTIMGHVLSRNFFEDAIPTLDNDFMTIVASIPAKKRYHYRAYKKFLSRLSPELSKIQYERTWMSPNWPYPVWNLGAALEKGLRTWNQTVAKATRGRAQGVKLSGYIDFATLLRTEPWRKLLGDTLANKASLMYAYGMINRSYVTSLLDAHISGRRDNREKLLYLVTFELILRRFFGDGTGL